jgi:hypothetical protein
MLPMPDPLPPLQRPCLPWLLPAVLAGLLAATAGRAAGAAPDATLSDAALCGTAIAATEPGTELPPHLLTAIGLVESGRADPASGTVVPWPWTINVAGVGQTFDTREAAIAAVAAAQRSGIQSIDVGCMQVNLFFHPHAFVSLEEAFDPAANVRYAARFLEALHAETGAWPAAVAGYHSFTPELGTAYVQRVAATWPLAARFGLSGWVDARTTAAALAAEVDPNHVLTPEFRAQMIAAAEFRHEQEAAHGVATPAAGMAHTPAVAAKDRKTMTLAALEAEVDPQHVLTAEFRAKLVEAAAFRHQQDAARQPPSQALATRAPLIRIAAAASAPALAVTVADGTPLQRGR